jgi:hypothetical protein
MGNVYVMIIILFTASPYLICLFIVVVSSTAIYALICVFYNWLFAINLLVILSADFVKFSCI